MLWVRWTGLGPWFGVLIAEPHHRWNIERSYHDVAVTSTGNVIVGGVSYHDLRIGNQDQAIRLGSNSGPEKLERGYVARLSPTGVVEWAWEARASGSATVQGVAADADGNVYVCGSVMPLNSASFGRDANGRPFRLAQPSESQATCTYLAKLDSAGNTLWVRPQSPRENAARNSRLESLCWDVEVGQLGNVFLTTRLSRPTDLDASREHLDQRDLLDVSASEATDHYDSVLSCWSDEGQLQWRRVLAAQVDVTAWRLAAKPNGGVLLAGTSQGSGLRIDDRLFQRFPDHSSGSYVVAINSQGRVLGDRHFYGGQGGNNFKVRAYGVDVDRNGLTVIVGMFRPTMRAPTGHVLFGQKGHWDAFVTILPNTTSWTVE